MYDIGATVVCVDDNFDNIGPLIERYKALPEKGKTYTVRDVVPGVQADLRATCTLYLEELINDPNLHGIEPGFLGRRFVEPDELEDLQKKTERQPKKETLKPAIGTPIKAPRRRELVPA